MRGLTIVVALMLALPGCHVAGAQHEHSAETEGLGSVSFETSCSPAVQPRFNRAVALMHSFQFAGAIEDFHRVLAADPACAMAYWGIALSQWGNPFAAGLKSEGQVEQGRKAVEQARGAKPKTPREREYIDAVAHLYVDAGSSPQRSRVLAYESAMAGVSGAHPEDTEAAIFYALAIASAADPADKSYVKQLQAGKILEALYVQHPNHPGLAHYIIHAYDVPPLAARASGAAAQYSKIAPATPHALHMPSHTFTRLGDWQASISANLESAKSARSAHQPIDELHADDYLAYAYLQTAQDRAAQQVMETAPEIFARLDPAVTIVGAGSPSAAYFARAAIPARFCLERRAWREAAQLEPQPSAYPHTEAITYFARGMGAAHLKDTAAARAAIDALGQRRDKLVAMNEVYWANQVEIQRQEVSAWLRFAEGDMDGALAGMRAAAAMEDKTEKSAVTPGPLAPARELLGELLLEAKRPAEAVREFEATLEKEPNRFRSIYGAAEAAKLCGDGAKAQMYFARVLELAKPAEKPERAEIAEARTGAMGR